MKKIIYVLILFYSTMIWGQGISIFDIDTTNFPKIKAQFYAWDKDGKQVTPNIDDLTLTENGIPREILNISCPGFQEPQTISLAFSIDKSGSMSCSDFGDVPVELAKTTVKNLVDFIFAPPSELALQSCDAYAQINQDFTKSKNVFYSKLTPITAGGDNDFVEQLLNPQTGLLNIAKTGKNSRKALIVTDAWWLALTQSELQRCIDTCNKYQIQFYAIIYSRPEAEPNGIKSSLKSLCDATGGKFYDGIISREEAANLAVELQQIIQENAPCEITWQSSANCQVGLTYVDINLNGVHSLLKYTNLYKSIAKLIFKPNGIYFKNKMPGKTYDTTITVTAVNSDFQITNIASKYPFFQISPNNFTIKSGESKNLIISFTPPDSNWYYDNLQVENNKCIEVFSVIAGFVGGKVSQPTLKLIHPNGGEQFLVGSDTVITWVGVLPSDTVKLEYSINGGKLWNVITNSATGLQYIWKNLSKPISNQCLIRVSKYGEIIAGSAPKIEWQKCLGGSDHDVARSVQQTLDGGYIVAGYTSSFDGDVTGNHGSGDYWVVKLDQTGIIEWQKCLGGSGFDEATSIQQTVDGGYIVAGSTYSIDGDVVGLHIGHTYNYKDYWIVKLNQTGDMEWQKCLGGKEDDAANSIQQTIDGGYIVAGYTSSFDGDVTGNHGYADYWIVKLNQTGDMEWQKCLGGKETDDANSIQQTIDGGYIVTGYTDSFDGDVSGHHGSIEYDDWIVKLDQTGDMEWQKCLGGSGGDIARSVQQTIDGGYIVAGNTFSFDGDINGNHGTNDYWIVKLDQTGDMEWQKCLGGSDSEGAYSIQQTIDGSYILAGTSYSNDGDVTGNHGTNDYWIVKLDQTGDMEWQKCLGGNIEDQAYSIQQTLDGGYIVAGDSQSNDGDLSGHHSDTYDYWIVKLSADGSNILQQDVSDSLFAIVAPEAAAKDIDMKQCLVGTYKDSVIIALITNSGTYPCRIDTIYFTGAEAYQYNIVSKIFPVTVPPGGSQTMEIAFQPASVGIKNAQIVIVTQSDTLIQNITGEGVQPTIAVLNKFIDFGIVEVGSNKDTLQTTTIANISSFPIDITKTTQAGPNDIDFTTLAGGGAFTLNPGDTAKLDLRFAPSSIGRTSGRLQFYYNGAGSPATVQLFGQGLGGLVIVDSDSAYAGENKRLKLRLGNNVKPGPNTDVTSFKARLRFNRTLLTASDPQANISFDAFYETVDFTGNWDGKSDLLGTLNVTAGLGNADSTDLLIENFTWLDSKGNEIDFETETESGTFKLLGICPEGGNRLVNPDAVAGILNIAPNPAENSINIDVSLTELGSTELSVYNVIGERVKLLANEDVLSLGKRTVTADISDLGTGQYVVVLKTPTILQKMKLAIVK